MKVEHRQRVWRSNARMSCSSAAVYWEAVADSAMEDLKGCTNIKECALGHLRKSRTVGSISSVSVCVCLFVHWSTVCLTLRSEFLRWCKFLTLNLGFIDFTSVFVLIYVDAFRNTKGSLPLNGLRHQCFLNTDGWVTLFIPLKSSSGSTFYFSLFCINPLSLWEFI